jgi:polysaccharide transporter, PST family
MRTERPSATAFAIILGAVSLLWPALWNGYPLVFSDTGTYLTQAIEGYVGWDRPIFYSLFLLPLHMTVTTWPVIAVQALLLIHLLHLMRRTILPGASVVWLLPIALGLSIASPLPWFSSQLMPDVFTGIVVLTLALLIFARDLLSTRERIWLAALAAFAISVHQSHVPLAAVLLFVFLPLRRCQRSAGWGIAPLLLALIALTSVNLVAFGRASVSPFGNVFLLTRVIYDGPGLNALRRDCPAVGWRLCPFIGSMPALPDDFLWRADGPVMLAGGAKLVSRDANAILMAAVAAEPVMELFALAGNSLQQLSRFASGDGLQPWPETVAPRIARHFPRFEKTAFTAVTTERRHLGSITMAADAARSGRFGRHRRLLRAVARRAAQESGSFICHDGAGGIAGERGHYRWPVWPSRPIPVPNHVAAAADGGARRCLGATCCGAGFQLMQQNHAANVFWSGFEATASALFSFSSAFIVARFVGPAEVGIGAAAVAVHVLLWVVVNALFADALVQRSNVDEETFATAVLSSIAIGCAAAGLQAASGPLTSWFLHDHRLPSMSLALALPLPLVGAAGPVQGMLTRNRAYRQLAGRTVIGQGIGTVVGITGALLGAGAWALVAQQLVTSAAGAIVLLACGPTRPRRMFSVQRLREMLRIGLPLTASTMVHHGRYRIFALLIGGTAGATALGQVHMAFRLIDAVRELVSTAQWRLMLPFLSERQNDVTALHAGIDRCLRWSSLLTFPLCGAMAVAVQPLTATLLGPIWQPAGQAALPLIALMTWLFLSFPAGVAVVARGKVRYTLIANIAGTAATIAGVMLVRPATPVAAALVWLGGQIFISPYVLAMNMRVLNTSILGPLRAGVPALIVTALATAVAFVAPPLIGQPHLPGWLLLERVGIVAATCSPLVLIAAGPSMLLKRPGTLDEGKLTPTSADVS